MSAKQQQFDALVRATSGDLFRFGYWLARDEALAQDLVQETYMRAWRSLDDLRDTAAAKAWLITILRREHARLFERKRLDVEPLDDVVVDDRVSRTPEQSGEDTVIRAAIAKLDPKYREPLLLQVLGGYSCEEIARELNLSAAAVMTQLFRARQKLKAALGGGEEGVVHELS
ncbi:MAG TPA: sigma-70 family RNA polymerase sigma factor [Xanthomonadales bacterium]|nr:sigma-70 family RNA polymerase sigma factor [Xanthomonadales bacterium]